MKVTRCTHCNYLPDKDQYDTDGKYACPSCHEGRFYVQSSKSVFIEDENELINYVLFAARNGNDIKQLTYHKNKLSTVRDNLVSILDDK